MKLRALRERAPAEGSAPDLLQRQPARLRPVDQVAEIVPWPHQPDADPGKTGDETIRQAPVTFLAEIRTKRFGVRTVEDTRYEATIATGSTAPHALLAALAAACADIDDFHRVAGPDERVIVQISLRG